MHMTGITRQQTDPNGITFTYYANAIYREVAAVQPDTVDGQRVEVRSQRLVTWRRRQPFADKENHGTALLDLWNADIKVITDVLNRRNGDSAATTSLEPFTWEVSRAEIKNEARRLLRAIADTFGSDTLITSLEQKLQTLSVMHSDTDESTTQQLWNLNQWDTEMINIADECAHEIMSVYMAGGAPVMDIATLISAGERGAQSASAGEDQVLVIGDYDNPVFYNDRGSCAGGFFSLHIPHYMAIEQRCSQHWSRVGNRHPLLGYVLSCAYFGPELQYALLLAGSHDGVKLHKSRTISGDVRTISNMLVQSLQVTAGAARFDGLLTLGNPNQRKSPLADAKFLNHGKKVALKVLERLFTSDLIDTLNAVTLTQTNNPVLARLFASLACVQYSGVAVQAREVYLTQRPMDAVLPRPVKPMSEPQNQPASGGLDPRSRPVSYSDFVTKAEMRMFDDKPQQDEDTPCSIALALGLI